MKNLDCGHEPSVHGEHTTGTARTRDGREICWECSHAGEVAAMSTADSYTAYLVDKLGTPDISNPRYVLTDWPGKVLARVTYLNKGRHNIGGSLYRFRAVDTKGAYWYGTSPGPGMYARMHRAKA